jgi:hypothetical protein
MAPLPDFTAERQALTNYPITEALVIIFLAWGLSMLVICLTEKLLGI